MLPSGLVKIMLNCLPSSRFNSVCDLVKLTTITFGMDNCFDRSVACGDNYIIIGHCVLMGWILRCYCPRSASVGGQKAPHVQDVVFGFQQFESPLCSCK